MSQNTDSSSIDRTSSLNNDDCGWANFNTFEKQNCENNAETTSNNDDDWADFQTTKKPSIEHSTEISDDQINQEEDVFGDYGEVHDAPQSQLSTLSVNSLSSEQIESVISTCFPLESSTLCTVNDDSLTSFPLPTFTTCEEQIKQIPSFHHSLSLWRVLVNVSNDPLGIQYQWRKSNIERSFHQALGVQERFRAKTNPVNSSSDVEKIIPSDNNENKLSDQLINPSFDWKSSGLENPLTDNHSSFLPTDVNKSENHVVDINKTLDLDYYIPPITTSTNRRQQSNLSTIVHRNSSPNLSQQSTSIKTIDLFPGSTTTMTTTDDTKSVNETVPNFTFMNPKALLFSTQTNTESNILF